MGKMEGEKSHMSFSPLLLWVISLSCHVYSINIDLEHHTEFSGPEGSYFGFSVDFLELKDKTFSVVAGAPKAETNQPGVSEGGSVFLCPWPASGGPCRSMGFDETGDQVYQNENLIMRAYKSHQWFGATVRVKDSYVLACAPLFHWNVLRGADESLNTPVGNCQILNLLTGQLAHYAPCRGVLVELEISRLGYRGDKRYCEAGFSSDITKDGTLVLGAPGGFFFQGQLIVTPIESIMSVGQNFSQAHFVHGETVTKERHDDYDLYMGYSVGSGHFSADSLIDYVVGIPNERRTAGAVHILKGSKHFLLFIKKLSGTQVASYFGHSIAVTDINRDGLDDILVGAPLFMRSLSSQHLQEVGQVYVYLQKEGHKFPSRPDQTLTGTHSYGRFGSAIASLGDLDQDGFNDVAVGAPNVEGGGRVFIYMGQSSGLVPEPSQVLENPFRSLGPPAAFGFSLRGGTDVDNNGYPDLIVGAWGVSKVAMYRALTVVAVEAQIFLIPDFLNPEVKQCSLPKSNLPVTCFTVTICISMSGHNIPEKIVLDTELQLDKMKQMMTRRTLLLHSGLAFERFPFTVDRGAAATCTNLTAYLQAESEMKDKLSPIFIGITYTLNSSQNAVLHGQKTAVAQTRIILDCGEDDICIPDLRLKAEADKRRLLIGDDNPALLLVEAENLGEGAYETELKIRPPANAHYQGILTTRKNFSRLMCVQKRENGTVVLLCDLGNPMKAGQRLQAGLFFSVGGLEKVESHVVFDLQIKSKNSENPNSDPVQLRIPVGAAAKLTMRGGSSPGECVLPISKWKPKDQPETLYDIGPLVEHVYELRNLGPSTINAKVEVELPTHYNGSVVLYVFDSASEDLTCHTDTKLDYLMLSVQDSHEHEVLSPHSINKREAADQGQTKHPRQEPVHVNCSGGNPCILLSCMATGLHREGRAVVRVMARLWVHTFLQRPHENYVLHSLARYEVLGAPSKIQPEVLTRGAAETETKVVWQDAERALPIWWIVVAIISGFLLLALLCFIFWKMGFFKRNRPPCEDGEETEGLNAEQSVYTEMDHRAET